LAFCVSGVVGRNWVGTICIRVNLAPFVGPMSGRPVTAKANRARALGRRLAWSSGRPSPRDQRADNFALRETPSEPRSQRSQRSQVPERNTAPAQGGLGGGADQVRTASSAASSREIEIRSSANR